MTLPVNNGNIQESTCNAGGFPLLWSAFSLVPEALIEDENPDLWLNFLRERVPHDQVISSVTFEDEGVVCLFEAKGAEEHVIPYLLTRAGAIDAPDKLLAIREGERLAIACYKAGKLQLSNIYEATTKEQALYWILKAHEELSFSKQTPVHIRCGEGTRKLLSSHLEIQELP